MLELTGERMLVWAHRGASVVAPENTVEAFRLAVSHGADGIEFDVRRTGDGRLVVHHDAITREGRVIAHHTVSELLRREPSIPTLEEALRACGDLVVNIEIKNSPSDPDYSPIEEQADLLVPWLAHNAYGSRVVVSSFNSTTLDRVRSLDPKLVTARLLEAEANPDWELADIAAAGHRGINPSIDSLEDPARLVKRAAALGLWVVVWTVDDPVMVRLLAVAGVTAVITNEPARARAALG